MIRILLLAAIALYAHGNALAQRAAQKGDGDFPNKPVRMVAGWPAGGGSDLIARVVCIQLSRSLGHPVIIDNRQGAGNSVASEIVANSAPNGYTLQFVNANHTLNQFVYGKLRYDIVKDFAPISQVSTSALVLVTNASFPATSLKDLIAMAKAKPGSLSAGTSGTAGSGAVTTEIFRLVSGLNFLVVPYKGGAPAMVALLQGEIQFAIGTQATTMGFIKSGKLKVLATSSKTRLAHLPGVPTFDEHGLKGLELGPWEGIIAPAQTPSAVIDRVYRDVVKALKTPEVLESLSSQGIEPVGSTPAEFNTHIRQQLETFSRVYDGGKIRRE